MTGEQIGEIFGIIFVSSIALLFLVVIVRIIYKTIKSQTSPVKTVEAVVVGKNVVERFSKYSGNAKTESYVIAFTVDGKKKTFYVSEFSYNNGYNIDEKGMLTYQGDKLISFE